MDASYPAGVRRQLELLEEHLSDGLIAEEDVEAIRSFAAHDVGQVAERTCEIHLTQLRTTARRSLSWSCEPLVDLDVPGIVDLLDALKNGAHDDVKAEGIGVSNQQKALRVFHRFHELGVDPADIDLDDEEGRNLRPDDLLFRRDVDGLLEGGLLNLRDRALFTLMLATGQRLDAVRTLRLEHVQMDGRTMDVMLNEEEGQLKGANGKKPLLWAKHYVRAWYEAHPYQRDDAAALFCPLPGGRGTRGEDDPHRDPLAQGTIRGNLRRAAERACLQKDVYPHLIRVTAITRMVLEDLSEQKIKRLVGWSPDSSQFGTYVRLADELTNDSIRESLGLPTSEAGTPIIGRPSLERCACGEMLPDGRERCPSCGEPLTHSAAAAAPAVPAETGPTDVGLEKVLELLEAYDHVRETGEPVPEGGPREASKRRVEAVGELVHSGEGHEGTPVRSALEQAESE